MKKKLFIERVKARLKEDKELAAFLVKENRKSNLRSLVTLQSVLAP